MSGHFPTAIRPAADFLRPSRSPGGQVLPSKPLGSEFRNPNLSPVPPAVHEVLRSPGQPLDTQTRAFMEPRFGHDFSKVRVHADAKAMESARAVNALAYTVGSNVVFGPGRYQPTAKEGQKLLGHELTHVLQQRGGGPASGVELKLQSAQDPCEQEAERTAASILKPGANYAAQATIPAAVRVSAAPNRIQRAKGELFGALGGAAGGAIIGGLLGGLPGAIIGGLAGAAIGAVAGHLLGGESKVKLDASCKNFCPGLDFEQKAKQADGKAGSGVAVKFVYQVTGASGTSIFDQKVQFNNILIKCDSSNANCGGWSSKGVITLGKSACNAAVCGDLASTILHEMVHDWAGWGPPYDKKNITVPGAAHTAPDYLDEWVARYVEKVAFSYDPWGLP